MQPVLWEDCQTILRLAHAGGLGLAALQIAAAAGAQVVGTAGSAQKRAHLRSAGAAAAVSSRATEYAEAFAHPRRRPSIVLNSLTSPGVVCAQGRSVHVRIAASGCTYAHYYPE